MTATHWRRDSVFPCCYPLPFRLVSAFARRVGYVRTEPRKGLAAGAFIAAWRVCLWPGAEPPNGFP